jgi:DinB superfamily
MSEAQHLAYVVESHFSNPKSSSFAHFVTVTDSLTGEQAATAPRERFNSIWAVVNHVAFWQEVTRLGLLGQEINLAEWGLTEIGGGWPPLGEISDAHWLAARQRALDCNHAFAQTIASLTDEQLETEIKWLGQAWQAILAIYSHNSHHTSEILTIRHMLGLWVDHPWA